MECLISKIRKNSIKICLPVIVISVIFIIIGSIYYFSLHNKNIPEINEISYDKYADLAVDDNDQALRKDLVTFKVQYIISNYMSDNSGQYYIVQMPDGVLVSMYVPALYVHQFNTICDNSMSYEFGVYNKIEWNPVYAYGYLKKISISEKCSIINTMLDINHMTVSSYDIAEDICDYSFIYTYKYKYEFFPYICFIVSLVGFVISIIIYIIFPAVYISSYSLSKGEIAEISKDYTNGEQFDNIVFGRKYLIFRSTKQLEYKNNIDLVWAYKKTIKKRYVTILHFTDGSTSRIKCINEKEADDMIRFLKDTRPDTQIPYSEELFELFNSSIADFIVHINRMDKGKQL
ncbi:MAG: hypothetical protein Q4F95_12310 [Oscillospiraceae bacterium]|nr:hypothetical protein [Oscillospiraceae bacterium]